ncbi:hypothetical protein TREMEDRAFT_58606 [Tremella mesenterica DSM 1558]|uniref:uncharacterized protein n=1 Tax=Tremella mesenterica (strain ATCC 24925 / CBS 8224 / DSM 1558 / NBRC 9311 / NRRL Y-6157 / RJB 2259-6 / UBC 559-6) TaxID=578456 RepID=UPI0003F4911F|nr:uncharacterized protein TREMEDRAFT_58606 [Tremella mesenterica DSM 1558]EIW72444.1 hypothetical protein TREMEDRAFT_58606 [Tremella mesenterica DSM 1558]
MSEYLGTTLNNIPILSNAHGYYAWSTQARLHLTIVGCIGIIKGTDTEAYRSLRVSQDIRAGSMPPREDEMDGPRTLGTDEMKRWDEWRKRELRAQGVIQARVDMGLLMEIQELSTAKEMWDWLENDMKISTPHHCSAIERKLRTHFLPSNSSVNNLVKHLTTFNSLFFEAKHAGCEFSDNTCVQLFLDSLTRATDFDIALRIFQQQCGYLHTWDNVRKMYQGEIARREARGEGDVVGEVNTAMQKVSLEHGAKGKGKPWFKGKKGGNGGGGKDSQGKG